MTLTTLNKKTYTILTDNETAMEIVIDKTNLINVGALSLFRNGRFMFININKKTDVDYIIEGLQKLKLELYD